MKRIPLVCIVAALAFVTGSCGGNSTLDDSPSSVVLTVEIEEYNPEIDVCFFAGFDLAISKMNVKSNPKNPDAVTSTNMDVTINRWEVTPYRTDGGSTASPVWVHDMTVFVPAEGETELENYRVFPAEYYDEAPLSYLQPANGGTDPETGQANIRQSLRLQMFGRTVGGKSVATEPVAIAFNFFCGSP
jgi:hypothetical protein